MLYERVNDSPALGSKTYLEFEESLMENPRNDYDWCEYYGSGVPIDGHPLKRQCRMRGCAECESDNVKVIYAKWCVSVHSGDSYYDYEVVCADCGKFTARSYNEND